MIGCGGDDESADGPPPTRGATALTVTLEPRGPDGPSRTGDVSCPPGEPTGREARACEALAEIDPAAAEPVPPGTVCTQIYGGPDVVRLQGTLDGTEIDAELTRENGCEINRFDRFLPLLEALFPGYEPGQSLRP